MTLQTETITRAPAILNGQAVETIDGTAGARFGDTMTAAAVARRTGGTARSADEPGLPIGFDSLEAAQAGLTAHLERRREIRAEVARHVATIARLDALLADQGAAAAALAAFDASEAEAVRQWAAGPSDYQPPEPRSAERAELTAAVQVAEERAAAARAARETATAEVSALNMALAASDGHLMACGLSVVGWSADPIIERVKATIAALEADLIDLSGLNQFMMDEAHRAREAKHASGPVMVAKAVAIGERVKAAAGAFADFMAARRYVAKDKWAAFAAELTREPDDGE